ncbi:RidA family protein [Abditibacterium utsteinense]|uniref:RidA family protein n=1 Tax=Abditibacterium utsteinense TaxID=1960156 RepID=A0A2S8SUZ3_9BACT|nr:RidA family protein [Abditibacterium utsteinense]PQV64611.1 RidA family protein [Abditibacterium utsteinense]
MKNRQNISSGSAWETTIGYSRAVRVGQFISVAGTTASSENGVEGAGDAGAQTRFILQKIERALIEAGATLQNVTRTRIFLTDISQWENVGRAHGEVFGEIRPVTTMVEVSALIGEEYLVEIEADAILDA